MSDSSGRYSDGIDEAIETLDDDVIVDDDVINDDEVDSVEGIFIPKTSGSKKISFPVDSILNAVIQDGDVMELLRILQYKISDLDVNQRNHTGLTALHHAVLTNNIDSVKLLLNHGADISVQDAYGFSPLHTAAALGFLQITSLLIVFGADVFSLTKQLELPIDVAKDIAVIRVLSNEMYLKIHAELYFKSIVRLKVSQFCTTFITYLYQLLLIILKFIVFFIETVRSRYSSYKTIKMNNGKSKHSALINSDIRTFNIKEKPPESNLNIDASETKKAV